jgi:hypothetical protein
VIAFYTHLLLRSGLPTAHPPSSVPHDDL